jgi:hypothetical protein
VPKLDTNFVVICRSDSKTVERSGERTEERYVAGHYELATRRVFATEDEARTYARGISPSREPLVVLGDWLHLRETAAPGEETPPRFAHDCQHCVFLGRFKNAFDDCDLYFCAQNASSTAHGHPTVIARFSDEGPDYSSGLPVADKVPALAEAKRRAKARGLLP